MILMGWTSLIGKDSLRKVTKGTSGRGLQDPCRRARAHGATPPSVFFSRALLRARRPAPAEEARSVYRLLRRRPPPAEEAPTTLGGASPLVHSAGFRSLGMTPGDRTEGTTLGSSRARGN